MLDDVDVQITQCFKKKKGNKQPGVVYLLCSVTVGMLLKRVN